MKYRGGYRTTKRSFKCSQVHSGEGERKCAVHRRECKTIERSVGVIAGPDHRLFPISRERVRVRVKERLRAKSEGERE